MRTNRYKYYQPNRKDLKDTYGDCVIRALCRAYNKAWLIVFDELVPISRDLQTTMNEKQCYEEYLRRQGAVYTGISNKKGTKRPTVSSFAQTHKKGTYFLNLANHCVAVVDGQYFDTWDCGQKSLYGFWTVSETDENDNGFMLKKSAEMAARQELESLLARKKVSKQTLLRIIHDQSQKPAA